MNVFISGGCKNGKSYYAQHIAKAMALGWQPGESKDMFPGRQTGKTRDIFPSRQSGKTGSGCSMAEKQAQFQAVNRIDVHAENKRPLYYVATMLPKDAEDRQRIKRHLADREGWGFITIECPDNILDMDLVKSGECREGVFLLDSVTAMLENAMFKADGSVDMEAPKRIGAQLVEFAKLTGSTVFVSDYIYSDAIIYYDLTEKYKKGLADVDRALAKVCDAVVEIAYSNMILHKAKKICAKRGL